MVKELVVATKNKGKLREIKELLSGLGLQITSLSDYPEAPEIIESGKTFRANALIKARVIAQYTNKLTLGEDSGIEVRALGNRPGVYSARYSGNNADDRKNNQKLLRELKQVSDKDRQARYRCCAALVDGHGADVGVVDGRCHGFITRAAKGKNGFGYDPYFLIEKYQKTFGQLDPGIKAQISHRAKALKKIRQILIENYPHA